MRGPTGKGYIVVKTIKGHRYRYRQWTWRDGSHVRTKSLYLGPALPVANWRGAVSAIEPGDIVRATNKHTGQTIQRQVRSVRDDALVLVEPTSGIPFKFPRAEWTFDLVTKRTPLPQLQFKVGDQFIDNRDGEVMTVFKVLTDRHLYILHGTTGADATVSELQLLEGHSTYVPPSPAQQVADLETDLRACYAASPRGPLKTDHVPLKPSPDDILGFGEETLTYAQRLAAWQSRIDDLAAQSKVDVAFSQIRAEFELSEPGYRVIAEDAHQHSGRGVYAVPSTFPVWVPDHLRRKDLFDRLLADLTPGRIAYPTRPNAHRQRALVHAILDEVDRLAGIDTSKIRATIMRIYGRPNFGETA